MTSYEMLKPSVWKTEDLTLCMEIRTHSHGITNFELFRDGWPPEHLWPLLSLAQHHGMPTRLLDWSTDGNLAAYFAAKSALQNISRLSIEANSPQKFLAVYRADSVFFDGTLNFGKDSKYPTTHMPSMPDFGIRVHVVDAPYNGNQNLAAQKGRFTFLRIDPSKCDLDVDVPLDECHPSTRKTGPRTSRPRNVVHRSIWAAD